MLVFVGKTQLLLAGQDYEPDSTLMFASALVTSVAMVACLCPFLLVTLMFDCTGSGKNS